MSSDGEPRWRRYLRFHGRDARADLEDELEFHLAERAAMYERAGMSAEEARRAAEVKMGDLSAARRDCAREDDAALARNRRRERARTLFEDFHYARRSLLARPGFAIIATSTLALGAGVTAGIFSIVDSVLLRPLPYPTEDRVAVVWEASPEGGRWTAAPGKVRDWREQAGSFAALAALISAPVTVTGRGDPERVSAVSASAEVESVFGVTPIAGRWFGADEVESGARVVVLGHDLWVRRYGGTDRIVGDGVFLDGERYEVIGVMPPHFGPLVDAELWVPHGPLPDAREAHYVRVAGLLAPGVEIVEARREMSMVAARLAAAHPESDAGFGIELVELREELLGDARTPLIIWLGAVGLVLLIGVANLSNLFLARGSSRMPEIALRRSLGASRSRILRQLLTENLALAAVAGAIAFGLAVLVRRGLLALEPGLFPRVVEEGVGLRLVVVAVAICALTGVLAGLIPAIRLSGQSGSSLLGGVGRRAASRIGRDRLMTGLIVGEIGLAVMLTVGAALLIQTLRELRAVDPGFATSDRLAFRVSLPDSRYASEERKRAFYRELRADLAAIPGVVDVGAANGIPMEGVPFFQATSSMVDSEGEPIGASAPFRVVTPGYFAAAGIGLLSGRTFDARDREGSTGVVVVEELLAESFFPGEEPLGRRLRISYADAQDVEVIGVVRDVRQFGPQSTPTPGLYVPVDQVSWSSQTFVLHLDRPVAALAPAIRAAVRRLDPDLPLYRFGTIEGRVSQALGDSRFQTLLLAGFAALALLLGVLGVYGVLSYTVGRRTREIGIRVALGAGPRRVIGSVVRWGSALGILGISLGIAGAFALSRVIESQLYGVGARDLRVYAVVSALAALAVLAASWIPARRAAGVDPVVALRQE